MATPLNVNDLVYVNGEFVARDAARISVFDRGFVFGDGVYEVIPAYGGRLFRLPHHLQRLQRSLDGVRIANPHTAPEWQAIFERLMQAHGRIDQYIYMQVTRGIAPRDHAFPKGVAPTVFAFAQPIAYPDAALLASGVRAITAKDVRWQHCDIKAIALLPNVLMRQNAIEHGAVEAILLRDEQVTEGAASNIFIVERGTVVTPAKGPYILPGVTRDLVLELAAQHGVPYREAMISRAQLFAADEIWLTSSTKEILPIVQLDDKTIGTGRPGPLHAKLHGLLQDYKEAFRHGKAQ